jgi:hypothetical protein
MIGYSIASPPLHVAKTAWVATYVKCLQTYAAPQTEWFWHCSTWSS